MNDEPSGVLVGLDIGGTKTAVQVVDWGGQVVAKSVSPTAVSGPADLAQGLAAAINDTLAAAGVPQTQILSIGAGIPGLVNPATGDVRLAVNLNLEAYPLGEVLKDIYGVPVILENDVRMAAVGAYDHLRSSISLAHMAYLSIGTGISAGIILDSHLHRGANGMAGEIGHVIMALDGALCSCGQYGCLETIVAGPAILRQWWELSPDNIQEGQTPGAVYKAAALGDPAARQVVEHVSRVMAQAIEMLIMAYDVQLVVLGGGVIHIGEPFWGPIFAALAGLGESSDLARAMLAPEKVRLLPPDFDPATWGAMILARELIS